MNHLKNSEDSFSRRMVLAGAASAVGLSLAKRSLATSFDSVEAVEQRFGGRIGVFAIDTGSGRTLSHRANERFLMCSTFKGLLAAQILARVDTRQESLKRLIPYTEKDLIFTSPVTKANVAKGALSVADLCQAMLEESDNTAAILLMRSAGGPKGLTRYLRSLGDKVTRSDRFEPDSNSYDGDSTRRHRKRWQRPTGSFCSGTYLAQLPVGALKLEWSLASPAGGAFGPFCPEHGKQVTDRAPVSATRRMTLRSCVRPVALRSSSLRSAMRPISA
jgi:beta-lactamase class A